jgi:hypothetical protein
MILEAKTGANVWCFLWGMGAGWFRVEQYQDICAGAIWLGFRSEWSFEKCCYCTCYGEFLDKF